MALGKIIEITGLSQITGISYRLEVLKDGYSGSVINTETTSRIFTLSYEPDTDDIAANLCPSTLEFDLYQLVSNENEISDFINGLIEYQQEDYYVRVFQERPGENEKLYWCGIIMQDEIIEQDKATKSGKVYTLTAVDGLALLKTKKYIFSNTPDYSNNILGSSTIKEIIQRALGRGLDTRLWGDNDNYLVTSADWTPDSIPYDDTEDIFDKLHFDVNAFLTEETLVTIDDVNGDPLEIKAQIRANCYEVLKKLARSFLCRIYMADGAYHFEQITGRASQTITRYVYDRLGVKTATQLDIGLVINLNKARGNTKLADGEISALPALQKVIVEQKSYNAELTLATEYPASNLLYLGIPPYVYATDIGLFGQFIQNTPIANTIQQRIEVVVEFDMEQKVNIPENKYAAIQPAFYYGARQRVDLEIILVGSSSGQTYYFDGLGWFTTTKTIELEGDRVLNGFSSSQLYQKTLNRGTVRTVKTTALPETGRIEIRLLFADVQRLVDIGPNQWQSIDPSYIGANYGPGVKAAFSSVYNNNTSAVSFYSIEGSNSKIGDNESTTIDEVVIGDGAKQTGHVMSFDSSTGQYSALPFWNYANESENYSLAALLAKERLQLQDQPLLIYNGDVNWYGDYATNIKFDSKVYMPQEVEYNAGKEIMSGSYYLMERLEGQQNPSGNLGPGIKISGLNTSNNFGNFKFGGINVGGGQVGDTFYQNDETVQVNNTRSLKGERVNVMEVPVGDGTMYSILPDNRFVVFSWLGGNGTAVILLPDYEPELEGMNLQLVLDESFTTEGNKTITLATNAGTTVRGAPEFTLKQKETREQIWFTLTPNGWY